VAGPGDVVERILDADDPTEEALALLAADAEVRPSNSDVVLRGLAEIERYASETRHERPGVRGLTVYEVGENALVLAVLAAPRGGGERRHIIVSSVGFVVTVRDGKIKRIMSHPTWDAARAAVGLTPERERALVPRRRVIPRLLMRLWNRVAPGQLGNWATGQLLGSSRADSNQLGIARRGSRAETLFLPGRPGHGYFAGR
jgi:ketosteroid isomerase-like protein